MTGFWQSVEGGKEERKKAVRDEGNGQGKNHCKEECQFSHEREKIPYSTQTHVSNQAIIVITRTPISIIRH